MTEKSITTKEKKLKTLSRILWIVFLGIAIPSIAFIWALYPMNLSGDFSSRISETMLLIGPFLLLAGLGVLSLVIYYIFKYRLENEDDLFL
jgi:hypothetical protein